MINDIEGLYEKWSSEGEDRPFTHDAKWKGDMVRGFVAFCLREQELKHKCI